MIKTTMMTKKKRTTKRLPPRRARGPRPRRSRVRAAPRRSPSPRATRARPRWRRGPPRPWPARRRRPWSPPGSGRGGRQKRKRRRGREGSEGEAPGGPAAVAAAAEPVEEEERGGSSSSSSSRLLFRLVSLRGRGLRRGLRGVGGGRGSLSGGGGGGQKRRSSTSLPRSSPQGLRRLQGDAQIRAERQFVALSCAVALERGPQRLAGLLGAPQRAQQARAQPARRGVLCVRGESGVAVLKILRFCF